MIHCSQVRGIVAHADSHEANADALDLAGLDPLVLDTLDTEVRADVEAARRLHFAPPRYDAVDWADPACLGRTAQPQELHAAGRGLSVSPLHGLDGILAAALCVALDFGGWRQQTSGSAPRPCMQHRCCGWRGVRC